MLACKTITFLAQHGWNTTNILNNSCMSESYETPVIGPTLTMEIEKMHDQANHHRLQSTRDWEVKNVSDFWTGELFVGDYDSSFRVQFDTSSDWLYLDGSHLTS